MAELELGMEWDRTDGMATKNRTGHCGLINKFPLNHPVHLHPVVPPKLSLITQLSTAALPWVLGLEFGALSLEPVASNSSLSAGIAAPALSRNPWVTQQPGWPS